MSNLTNNMAGKTWAASRPNILCSRSEGSRKLSILAAFALTVFLPCAGSAAENYRFEFNEKTLSSYQHAATTENGSGFFEGGSALKGEADYITSDKPFFFSVVVPEGNYRVKVTLGDKHGTSTTTVKAELRRLFVEHLQTPEGKLETRTFTVNVRRPEIGSTGQVVKFKEREKTSEARAWDDKLTLQFSDASPKVSVLSVEKVEVPTVYIAGDSTSTDQSKEPYNSWGQMITAFFKPDVAIANNGESGETARSFFGENRWAKVMSVIQKGDYILIQFGHNDQKEKGEGVGAFTTYKAELERMVKEARDHGATPILVTPMNRRTFDESGKITNSLGDFPAAVRKAADEQQVALIDLNAISKTLYEALGPEGSGKLFAGDDHTHHSDYGSYELAKCIVYGIKQGNLPLAKFLKTDLPAFDPAHPDPFDKFDLPADPDSTAIKPYGN